MQNEHGLTPPVSWDKVRPEYNWLATDENGGVFGYSEKPNDMLGFWATKDSPCGRVCKIEPPANYAICLWERPKINEQ